jgi:predicted ferric reductase
MAVVKKYKASIVAIKCFIDGIYTLDIQSLGSPFKYSPGQFLHLALDDYDPSCTWPDSRCFSIQTPPGSEIIRITYAVKGRFTKRMASSLEVGNQVTLKLPYGDLFTQDHNKKNTIFIAGGTGITPFLSLFNNITFREYLNPKLFAGYRTKSMNLYHAELSNAKEINPSFSAKYFYEDETGLINTEDILKEREKDGTYFISGPPAMIGFFKHMLHDRGIALANIKTDDWE